MHPVHYISTNDTIVTLLRQYRDIRQNAGRTIRGDVYMYDTANTPPMHVPCMFFKISRVLNSFLTIQSRIRVGSRTWEDIAAILFE